MRTVLTVSDEEAFCVDYSDDVGSAAASFERFLYADVFEGAFACEWLSFGTGDATISEEAPAEGRKCQN